MKVWKTHTRSYNWLQIDENKTISTCLGYERYVNWYPAAYFALLSAGTSPKVVYSFIICYISTLCNCTNY